MKKLWSLSTTVRNPERILPFLRVLKEMEGESFDDFGQIKFQTLLIQNRLYQPTGLSEQLLEYYNTSGDKMSYEQAQEIFEHMKSRSAVLRSDNGLRGRTSVAPLTKMGLAVAKQSSGKIKITDLGNAFLTSEIDIGDVYFRFFIKWQIPNLDSSDYSHNGTYDIKPFVGALHLIDQVNKKEIERGNEPKGISRDEFNIFVPSLVNYKDINSYATKIIELRDKVSGKSKQEKRIILNEYSLEFATNFLVTGSKDEIEKLVNNLGEYGDNAIRYFRLTRFFHIRGNGYHINIEPRRSVEINNLLLHDNSKAIAFNTKEEYLDYMSDIRQPHLPWETKSVYIEIIKKILEDIKTYESTLTLSKEHRVNYDTLSESELKSYSEELRQYRRLLQDKESHILSQNAEKIDEYIEALDNIYSEEDRPLALEKYTALSLQALNDAISIKPNYPVGDDNEPTFTAPAGKPDIECYYQNFNSICEVTMLKGRDQWYNEGQPVMRHLREFENNNNDKKTYCLFIAPTLHRDTMNTFWVSIKYEYEGKQQKIVPLTIKNFTQLLKILSDIKQKGNSLKHSDLERLYEDVLSKTSEASNATEWVSLIPDVISNWHETLSV